MTDSYLGSEDLSAEQQIEHWLAEATPASAARLQNIAGSADSKAARKAARRALYALSQRGIVPLAEDAPSQIASAESAHNEKMRAWSSAYDGAGNRLFLVMLAGADGGLATVAQILANDELGIRDLSSERRRPREIAPLMERLEARIDEGLAVAEIEPDYARWLIARFREINFRRSTTTPVGFIDLLPRIGAASSSYETPPVYSHISVEEISAPGDFARDPADLFKLPWFDPWFFAVEDVIPWLEKWMQATSSIVVFAEKTKEDRKSGIAKEAAAVLITEEARARYITRLEESADILRRRERLREARQALFHALALKAGTPVGEVPFAEALAARTLEAAAEMAANARQPGTTQEN